MAGFVALLRAVNLGPHNKVAMADLRKLAGDLGLEDCVTLLQSGNLVFRSSARSSASLERRLEEAARSRLRVDTDCFVRTDEDWREVLAANPFNQEAASDPAHLLVMFLKAEPPASAVQALRQAIKGRERVEVAGRQAYFVYPDGIGRSRLTSAVIESRLGTRGTGRNWNTVRKLGQLAGL
ncbi:MAG TPA: DUF1697 domain-containing protein [Gemmatimonadales bacterium]|nr:DUF1697 domain-containing protein [Gemmatimonadales bacterium]